jgi:hypothetical protein
MPTLKLGSTDRGKIPANRKKFLSLYHSAMAIALQNKLMFRDEAFQKWRRFVSVDGDHVFQLQKFLKEHGFYPNSELSGIFGYGTLSAVRLFQEYVRTIEKDSSIGFPDGIAGSMTMHHIQRWKDNKLMCHWAMHSSNPTNEFKAWHTLLKRARDFYETQNNDVLEAVRNYPQTNDTSPPRDWNLNQQDTHLIGIRRNPDVPVDKRRENDDLFILLINGMSFKFWGSTDPNPSLKKNREAFLTECQHRYKFGWHKVSDETKVYKALRPFNKGVLVFRDEDGDNALNKEDIQKGLDSPNTTINIHWSGDGGFNFSAGCQVIAGRSYINDKAELIDCRKFSAKSYSSLKGNQTKAAYNMLADLVVCYTALGKNQIWYTLGRDENMKEVAGDGSLAFVKKQINELMFIS